MNGRWKAALVLLALGGLLVVALRRERPRRVPEAWPVNFGHRGDPTRFLENTRSSFRGALRAGAGGLELDVRITRDGHPVVMHDGTVKRTMGGPGVVSGMTLDEVRRLGAGGDGVPTLREVLVEFPGVPVNLDIKDRGRPGAEKMVLDVLRQTGAEHRVLVASESHRVLRRFRRAARGDFLTGASRGEVAAFFGLSLLRLERLVRPAYAALQVPPSYGRLRLLTPRFVAAAHAVGVRVDAWTINEAGRMRELLDLGVDGVMTDDPGLLAEVLEGRGPR
jgi:glycerophosphoryl diester phosphodiesterase